MGIYLSNKYVIILGLFVSLVASAQSFADDSWIVEAYSHAMESFSRRSAENLEPIDSALTQLDQIEGKAENVDLNYDILILESRAYYWKGGHTVKDEKIDSFMKGREKADLALKLNEDYSEGYYFAGINLARWAEAQGITTALGKKAELLRYVDNAISHLTREGQVGESVDGYGPDRLYGRVYFKVPAIFGGSHAESIRYLEKAYNNAKNVAMNVTFFAETLYSGNSREKMKAKQILDEMLSQDPNTYNPARLPETLEEFKEARKLRNSMR
jgi:hypothetical protein